MRTRRPSRITIRHAGAAHARRLHDLITANQEDGHLLPRTLDDVTRHAARFVIALRGRRIVGCGELAPLSSQTAEVRSLAVDPSARGAGAGTMLVEALRQHARQAGFDRLCAFTHAPAYFSRMGFSVVSHARLPEKISTDCVRCPQFRRCGQYAMVMPLDTTADIVEHEHTIAIRPS